MALLSELKRRKVFRAGGAYLVAVWVVLQVIDLVGPAVGFPDSVLKVAIFASALGLPVVLLLSWAYDITPDGFRKSPEEPQSTSVARPTGPGRWIELSVFVVLFAAVAYLLVEKLGSGPVGQQMQTLAVLPFDNLSSDSDQQYFADGLSEETLNTLAGIPGLTVIARTSSFAFRDSDLSIPEIAEQLGADFVLEGGVRRSEESIRVTARLLRGEDGSEVLPVAFDRRLGLQSILSIQEDLARAVALQLKLRILPSDKLTGDPPASLRALDLYLHGQAYLHRMALHNRASDEFRLAVDYFEQSIKADPEWAPSRQGLAATYHYWMRTDRLKYEEMWRKSFDQLQRALEIDPEYSPAWASLGFLYLDKRQFDLAQQAYGNLSPDDSAGDWGRGQMRFMSGDFESAASYFRRAMEQNPLSNNRGDYLQSLFCTGDFSRAVAEIQPHVAKLESAGTPSPGHIWNLAYAHAKLGNRQQAQEHVDRFIEVTRGQYLFTAPIYAALGQADRVEAFLSEIEALDRPLIRPYAWAAIEIGQSDRAFDYLEQAAQDFPERFTADFLCLLQSVKDEPRFERILDSINWITIRDDAIVTGAN